jgi:hypothetical protein
MKNVTNILLRRLLAVLVTTCCLSSAASAAVIDFESYSLGTIIDSEYAPQLTVSAVNASSGPDVAVIFDTANPTGGDLDLGGPFGTNDSGLSNNYNPGNVLIIHETNNCNALTCEDPDDEGSRNAGAFYFDFASAITLESIDFFDIETGESAKKGWDKGLKKGWDKGLKKGIRNGIRLFDEDDHEILPNTFFVPDTGGDNMWAQLLFGVDGVKRIELNMGGSGAIDNITFTAAEMPHLPVPAAVWLFGSGLIGLVGFARRKKV